MATGSMTLPTIHGARPLEPLMTTRGGNTPRVQVSQVMAASTSETASSKTPNRMSI